MAAEIEAIARAWMQHKYGELDINAIPTNHEAYGCERWGDGSWQCYDEEDKPYHALWDDLEEACDMARVAVEALESIGYLTIPEER